MADAESSVFSVEIRNEYVAKRVLLYPGAQRAEDGRVPPEAPIVPSAIITTRASEIDAAPYEFRATVLRFVCFACARSRDAAGRDPKRARRIFWAG